MKKIIIILIITLTTFMGENIYKNNKELKQNDDIANNAEIEDKISENTLTVPEENDISTEESEIEETADNTIFEGYMNMEKSETAIFSSKEEKMIQQPKTSKVQETQKEEVQVQVTQPKEETKAIETKLEPIKEHETESQKCSGTNHVVETGNSNKWFDSKQEAINHYQSIIKTWGDKWEKFEIDDETYQKNCPYGYEIWSCPLCEKWTINFYYN